MLNGDGRTRFGLLWDMSFRCRRIVAGRMHSRIRYSSWLHTVRGHTDFFCDPEKTTITLGEEKQADKIRNVTLQERTRSVPFAQPKTLNEIFRNQVCLSAFRPLAREVVDVLYQLQRQEDQGSQPLSARQFANTEPRSPVGAPPWTLTSAST